MSWSSGWTCLGIAAAAACITVLAEPPAPRPPLPAATKVNRAEPIDAAVLAERLLQANPSLTQAEVESILETEGLSTPGASTPPVSGPGAPARTAGSPDRD